MNVGVSGGSKCTDYTVTVSLVDSSDSRASPHKSSSDPEVDDEAASFDLHGSAKSCVPCSCDSLTCPLSNTLENCNIVTLYVSLSHCGLGAYYTVPDRDDTPVEASCVKEVGALSSDTLSNHHDDSVVCPDPDDEPSSESVHPNASHDCDVNGGESPYAHIELPEGCPPPETT